MTLWKWPSVMPTAPCVSGLCCHRRHFIETWVRRPSLLDDSVRVRVFFLQVMNGSECVLVWRKNRRSVCVQCFVWKMLLSVATQTVESDSGTADSARSSVRMRNTVQM